MGKKQSWSSLLLFMPPALILGSVGMLTLIFLLLDLPKVVSNHSLINQYLSNAVWACLMLGAARAYIWIGKVILP